MERETKAQKHDVQLGNAISKSRRAKNMTQSELATRCGISRNYICQIETGRKVPTLETVGNIAAALEVPIESIVGDDYVIRELRQAIDRTKASEVLAELRKLIGRLS